MPKKKLDLSQLDETDLEKFQKFLRILEGKPLSTTDVITQYTNPKEILERTNFAGMSLVDRQVYLRTIYKIFGSVSTSCLMWANLEAHALISYKGEGRKNVVEQTKSANVETSSNVVFTQTQPQEGKPEKKRFRDRFSKPAKETSEVLD